MRSSVLVVDNPQAAARLTNLLSRDYEVVATHDAESAMSTVRATGPTAIVTALDLPIVDGIELCRRIRLASTVPIIVLSRDADPRSEVAALDAGADDYICTPFCRDQLLARIRLALRRHVDPPDRPALGLGDFYIHFHEHRVHIHGRPVRLTPKEFELLDFMARRPNRVLPHRALLEAVWGPAGEEHPEYLRVFVGQLRKKIEADPSNPRYLVTEPWIGYRFNPAGSMQEGPRDDRSEVLQLVS